MKLQAILVTVFALAVVEATNYCDSSLCSRGRQHIACNNNGALAASCAADAAVVPISANLRTQLVAKHNELRNQIAKGDFSGFQAATRMATMQWDDELAQLAELNVKQCAMRHDQCRNTDQYKYAGQNLAFSGWKGTVRTVDDVAIEGVQMWFDEYKDASMAYINKYSSPQNGKVIGHFTQVVQDKANRVGCAVLRETKNNGFIYQYLACNYARTNILDYPVYTSGSKAASECSTGAHQSYKNLCSSAETYDVNA